MRDTNLALETPKRHASRELIEASREVIAAPAIANRLGHYAVRLADVLDRCEYTEIRDDGFIESPANPDAIPLVSRLMGEVAILSASDSGLTSTQRRSIDIKYGPGKGETADTKLKSYLSAEKKHREITKFSKFDQLAVTSNNIWSPREGVVVNGRPVVSMNLDGAVNGRLSPVVLLHELTHVLQKEEMPVRTRQENGPRKRLMNELEAYYVSDCIIQGHKDMGRQADLLGHTARHEVDKARYISGVLQATQNGSTADFYPSDDVIDGLTEKGLIDEDHRRDLIAAAS